MLNWRRDPADELSAKGVAQLASGSGEQDLHANTFPIC